MEFIISVQRTEDDEEQFETIDEAVEYIEEFNDGEVLWHVGVYPRLNFEESDVLKEEALYLLEENRDEIEAEKWLETLNIDPAEIEIDERTDNFIIRDEDGTSHIEKFGGWQDEFEGHILFLMRTS